MKICFQLLYAERLKRFRSRHVLDFIDDSDCQAVAREGKEGQLFVSWSNVQRAF